MFFNRNKEQLNIQWTGYGKKTPVITFNADVVLNKKTNQRTVGGIFKGRKSFCGVYFTCLLNVYTSFHTDSVCLTSTNQDNFNIPLPCSCPEDVFICHWT